MSAYKGPRARYETHALPNLDAIGGLVRQGAGLEDIARLLRISQVTLIKWRKEHKELDDAWQVGVDLADAQVEAALYKSAIGFYYKTQELSKEGAVVEIEKYQAPSQTAQIFWLKNRRPQKWRDKQEVLHGPTDELAKLIEASAASLVEKPAELELQEAEPGVWAPKAKDQVLDRPDPPDLA